MTENEIAEVEVHLALKWGMLQAAINATPDGGTLMLPEGVYQISTQLTIPDDKSITIQGLNGGATIEQTGTNQRVLEVGTSNACTNEVVLENIVITGGNISAAAANGGGGIRINEGCSLTLIDSHVTGNTSAASLQDANGGGIYNNSGSLTLIRSFVTDNKVTGGGSNNQGGGIYSRGELNIIDSVIADNKSDSHGGGLFVWSDANHSSRAYVVNSSFLRNNAQENGDKGGGGGAIHVIGSNTKLIMLGGAISENTSNVDSEYKREGAGVYQQSATSLLRGVAFSDNTSGTGNPHFHATSGSVYINGNFWSGNPPANASTVCSEPSCEIELTIDFPGNGEGGVEFVHNAAADAAFVEILDMLAYLDYNALNPTALNPILAELVLTPGKSFEALTEDGESHTWTVPVSMGLTFTATEGEGALFHGWSDSSGFSGSEPEINVTVPGADLSTVAAFWPPVDKIEVTGPGTVTAGTVSPFAEPFKVTALDQDGRPTRVLDDLSFGLTSSDESSTIYEMDGATPTTSVVVEPGSLSEPSEPASFRYKSTVAGEHTVTATGTGDAIGLGDDYEFTVKAAAPHHITLTGPASVEAGVASGAFTLTVVDAHGNPAPVNENTTFTLATSDEAATATFDPASPVTVEAEQSSVTFTYKNTKVGDGTHTITATRASGDVLTDEDASYDIPVKAAAISVGANGSKISVDQATRIAGEQTATVSVQLQDANGNAVSQADVEVTFTTTLGKLNGADSPVTVKTDASGKPRFLSLAY